MAANGTARAKSDLDNPFSYTGRYYHAEIGLMYFRARYYDPQTGEFISRDPLGYVDGMSQYRAYFVPSGVDPSGLDFIALAHFNIVTVFGRSFYHYSLEYWECPCVEPDDDGVEVGTQIELPHDFQQNCSILGTVELSTENWKVWGYNLTSDAWEETTRPVSVIVYGISNHGPIEAILPIFEDLDPQVVQQKWVDILDFSQSYEWAEQQGFGGNFQNWSKSLYHRTGTNSRTFIRQAVAAVNIPWIEMNPGKFNHPGRDVPQKNLDNSWLFYDDIKPHEFVDRAFNP